MASTLDSNRYKLHTKISIEDVEIVKRKFFLDGSLLECICTQQLLDVAILDTPIQESIVFNHIQFFDYFLGMIGQHLFGQFRKVDLLLLGVRNGSNKFGLDSTVGRT